MHGYFQKHNFDLLRIEKNSHPHQRYFKIINGGCQVHAKETGGDTTLHCKATLANQKHEKVHYQKRHKNNNVASQGGNGMCGLKLIYASVSNLRRLCVAVHLLKNVATRQSNADHEHCDWSAWWMHISSWVFSASSCARVLHTFPPLHKHGPGQGATD